MTLLLLFRAGVLYPATSTLVDAFAGPAVTSQWSATVPSGASITEGSGTLSITTNKAGGSAVFLGSTTTYSLLGSYNYVQWASLPTAVAGLQTQHLIQASPTDSLAFLLENGSLSIVKQANGVYSTLYTFGSVPTVPFYTRFRESGGTTYFGTSSDAISWSEPYSVTNPIQLGALYIQLLIGCWQTVVAANPTAQFANMDSLSAVTTDSGTLTDSASAALTTTAITGTDHVTFFDSGGLTYANAVTSDAPVAYWQLNDSSGGTSSDFVGSHDGAYTGVSLKQSGVPGTGGTSYLFTGASTSNITVPDSADLSFVTTTRLTAEAWIFLTSLPSGNGTIVAKGSGVGYEWALRVNSSGAVEFIAWDPGGTTYSNAISGNNALSLSGWHHIVGTIDQTVSPHAAIYLDGVFQASSTDNNSVTPAHNAGPLTIGIRGDNADFLAGKIDDVAVYPTVLSAARIQAHYALGIGPASAVSLAPNIGTSTEASLSDTSTVATQTAASDSGTETDSAVITARSLSSADSAALTDTSAVSAQVSTPDSATVSDSTAPSAQATSLDTATLTQSATIGAQTTAVDSGTAADTAALIAQAASTDTASLTDSAVSSPTVFASDSVALTDTPVSSATPAAVDSAISTDSASVTAQPTSTDSATAADTATVAAQIVSIDSSALSDVTAVSAQPSAAENVVQGQTAAIALPAAESLTQSDTASNAAAVAAADTASETEALTLTEAISGSDSATVVDSQAISATNTASDTSSTADSASIAATITAIESSTLTDSVSVSQASAIPASDSAALAETTTVALTVTDTASQSDALALRLSSTDAVSTSETVAVSLASVDVSTLSDTPSPAAATTGTDTAVSAEAVVLTVAISDTASVAATATISATATATDVVIVTDAASLAATLSSTDAATVSDTTAPSAAVSTIDSGLATEAVVLAASTNVTDTAATTESVSIKLSIAEALTETDAPALATTATTEAFSTSEAVALAATLPVTDSATIAEDQNVPQSGRPTVSDTAALSEATSLSATVSATESTTVSDALSLAIATFDNSAVSEFLHLSLTTSDSSIGSDAASPTLPVNDTASETESISLTVGTASTDAIAVTEQQQPAPAIAAQETAALTDISAISVPVSTADTVTVTDAQQLAPSLASIDSASATEGATTTAALLVLETAALTENATIAVGVGQVITGTGAGSLPATHGSGTGVVTPAPTGPIQPQPSWAPKAPTGIHPVPMQPIIRVAREYAARVDAKTDKPAVHIVALAVDPIRGTVTAKTPRPTVTATAEHYGGETHANARISGLDPTLDATGEQVFSGTGSGTRLRPTCRIVGHFVLAPAIGQVLVRPRRGLLSIRARSAHHIGQSIVVGGASDIRATGTIVFSAHVTLSPELRSSTVVSSGHVLPPPSYGRILARQEHNPAVLITGRSLPMIVGRTIVRAEPGMIASYARTSPGHLGEVHVRGLRGQIAILAHVANTFHVGSASIRSPRGDLCSYAYQVVTDFEDEDRWILGLTDSEVARQPVTVA